MSGGYFVTVYDKDSVAIDERYPVNFPEAKATAKKQYLYWRGQIELGTESYTSVTWGLYTEVTYESFRVQTLPRPVIVR